jgi:hypothetical protein
VSILKDPFHRYITQMQIFRSKKLLLVTTILLWIGVSSRFFAAQTDAKHSNEITNWLLTFADKEQSDLASIKLKSAIQQDQNGFRGMLSKASEIIIEHPDLFNLPVDSANSTDKDVFQVLLTQWDLHNQLSGMSDGLQTERNRVIATATNETFSLKYWTHRFISVSESAKSLQASHIPYLELITNIVIRPLVDGLSINAP